MSSWGPLIFGHADKDNVKAINKYSKDGSSYGAPTLHETEMAKKIIEMFLLLKRFEWLIQGRKQQCVQ